MGTTASGIWYPDASTVMNPLQTKFSTMAESIQTLLDDPNRTRTNRWFASSAARDAAITSPQVGMVAIIGTGTAMQETIYDGTAWRRTDVRTPVSNFTPVWAQLNVGNGENVGYWTRLGPLVFATVSLTFGSTTSISGNPYVNLTASGLPLIHGSSPGAAWAYEPSTAGFYAGVAGAGDWIAFANGRMSSTYPFTWGLYSRIQATWTYLTIT